MTKKESTLDTHIDDYLKYCKEQRCLDEKTVRAYRTDLTQFITQMSINYIHELDAQKLETYIATLHMRYKPRSARRKIASSKAFLRYLERKDMISENPFHKVDVSFRSPIYLPKTIPLLVIEAILKTVYRESKSGLTPYRRRNAIRDTAIIEMLFATGIRISELCNLTPSSVDLTNGIVLIFGKGSKERILYIGNNDTLHALSVYAAEYSNEIESCNHFFVNQSGKPLSDQSARRLICRYARLASVSQHITPHMFRHTFASALLDQGVDIRYIQEMLGHSSIHTTEIYTHISLSKQQSILQRKHPRNSFSI